MIVVYRGFGMLAPAFGILAALLMNIASFRLLGVSYYEDYKWPKLSTLILAGVSCFVVGVLLKRKRRRDAYVQAQPGESQSTEPEMENRRTFSIAQDHLMFIPLQYWSVIYFVAAIIYGLIGVSGGATKSQIYNEAPRPQATPVTVHTAPAAENLDNYKDLLFVDQTLKEIVTRYNAPNDSFAKAYQYVKAGKTVDAKRSLSEVLSNPEAEVREKLWAWRALRALGEKPAPNVANQVHGVVMEVPVDNWIDTLAVYSDGRARYVNGGNGSVIIWESTEASRITTLAKNLIKTAEPLIEKAPIYNKHLPPKDNVIRVSILTYGGIRIREAKQSDIQTGHILTPAFDIGTELLLKLIEATETKNSDYLR